MFDAEFPKFRFTDRDGWSRIIPGIKATQFDEFRELYRLFWRRCPQGVNFIEAISRDEELYKIALHLCELANIKPEWLSPHIVAGLVHSYTDSTGAQHFGVLQKLYFPNPDDVIPKG
ncbi:hypothetical protein NIES2135_53580 [Leptolyngbya boryana NIES-2135]|jgi:hypothetical protein|uniref:Uncharacterized protein n=1 Tax=Leptolyngbya boryana NIES-2135 TaxID=1973484 RepID=A0A1Z4JNY9_LEPBY|nr:MULTISPECIES: hypothetical protein [Leptolyngbya]BAY58485.1 hypothetical protein NIES2135_53580 [Leptolyngbya boryana NIES-2135]MBD2370959.1 hypothetical protein [Leptolyngbya sp. FACHB-161]MBD2377473.1 hypothetical protein [Leptolyngbya sp. FACHB-238]MBD2401881.1 hypothetical protein [Leptolyngbya sp. FACHB-239]MBD2408399.1 hypothetical protein [Leptolyngbya sp. FACHB-402]